MTNVLLVDDDYLVRMYLRQLIDWEKEGFWLVGDACNGEEALKTMAEVPVQLLITDLGMPVVDGIALIKKVREQYPDTRTVVLSCHDEFDYVKEAMRLGADEYVLKNALDADSLRALLASMEEKVAESQARQSKQQELWELAQRGSRELKNEVLEQLLAREYPYEEQARLLEKGKWSGRFYAVGAIALALPPQADTLVQICLQLLRDVRQEFFVRDGGVALIVAELSDITLRSEQAAHLRQLAGRVASSIEQYAAMQPCIAVSRVYSADGGITKALREGSRLLDYGFYGHKLVFADALPPMHAAMPALAGEVLAQSKAPHPDSGQNSALYTRLMEQLAAQPVAPATVQDWVAEMDLACGVQHSGRPAALPDCAARLAQYQDAWNSRQAGLESVTDKPSVRLAIRHIRQHFAEPLSLNSVADLVQLNPAYLSHIFKKETGLSFTEYLQQQRMDYVRKELASSHRPVKDIAAAAGFYDYRHFSKLFKKQTGMSPAEWKRQPDKT